MYFWYLILMLERWSQYNMYIQWINVRENREGQSKMDNPETLATLGTRYRTKTTKRKNTTQQRKLQRWATRTLQMVGFSFNTLTCYNRIVFICIICCNIIFSMDTTVIEAAILWYLNLHRGRCSGPKIITVSSLWSNSH